MFRGSEIARLLKWNLKFQISRGSTTVLPGPPSQIMEELAYISVYVFNHDQGCI